jgi:hypothetical protein
MIVCTYTHPYLSFTTSMPHDKIFNHQMCPVDCVNHAINLLKKFVLAMFFLYRTDIAGHREIKI